MRSRFLPVKAIKISWNSHQESIKNPSKKPWKIPSLGIRPGLENPVTKARGVQRVVAVHLRAARGQGSVRRGRQGPRGDDVSMAGIWWEYVYVCMFIYTFMNGRCMCRCFLNEHLLGRSRSIHFDNLTYIYIYISYCIIYIHMYIYIYIY